MKEQKLYSKFTIGTKIRFSYNMEGLNPSIEGVLLGERIDAEKHFSTLVLINNDADIQQLKLFSKQFDESVRSVKRYLDVNKRGDVWSKIIDDSLYYKLIDKLYLIDYQYLQVCVDEKSQPQKIDLKILEVIETINNELNDNPYVTYSPSDDVFSVGC